MFPNDNFLAAIICNYYKILSYALVLLDEPCFSQVWFQLWNFEEDAQPFEVWNGSQLSGLGEVGRAG